MPQDNRAMRALCGVFSCLGLASTIFWCKLMGHTPGFLLVTAGLDTWANARVFWLIGMLLMSLVFLILPKASRKADTNLRYMVPLLAVLGSGCFALSFHQSFFDPKMFAVVGIVISGLGYFWFISRFVLLLSVTQGLSYLAWCFALAFPLREIVLVFPNSFVSTESQVIVAIFLPVLSAILFEAACWAARQNNPQEKKQEQSGQPQNEKEHIAKGHIAKEQDEKGVVQEHLQPVFAKEHTAKRQGEKSPRTVFGIIALPKTTSYSREERCFLGIIVAAMALLLSITRACGSFGVWGDDHTADLDFLGGMLTVLFMLVAISLYVHFALIKMNRYPITMRFQLATLLVVAGLFLAAIQTQAHSFPQELIDFIALINDPFALLLTWIAVATAIDAFDVPANRIIGLAGSLYALASIVWVILIDRTNAVDSAFILVVVYLLFAVFLGYVQVTQRISSKHSIVDRLWPTKQPQLSPELVYSENKKSKSKDEENQSYLSQTLMQPDSALVDIFEKRCEKVSLEYGLSNRERAVFLLLIQGRTSTAIQNELQIAASTVKTHIQHIYKKLELKDRQELIDKALSE